MKLLTYILSIYFLLLTVMPCSDIANDCQDDLKKYELSENHSHSSDESDTCSPFCTCNCCSSSVKMKVSTFFEKPAKNAIITKEKFPLRDFVYVSSFYGNIWQPPKIS